MSRPGIAVAALLGAASAAGAQIDLGREFLVNTYTTGKQEAPAVAMQDDGSFVVVWQSRLYDVAGCYPFLCDAPGDSASGVFLQRFDPTGAPVGVEQHVNTFTIDQQFDPDVSRTAEGGFVVTWSSGCSVSESCSPDGAGRSVALQRFDAAGTRLGPEQIVNTFTDGPQEDSAVAATPAGDFVVVWHSRSPEATYDYDPGRLAGRGFGVNGSPAGDEFQVEAATTARQESPDVAAVGDGEFVVTWLDRIHQSLYAYDIRGRRFDANGNALGDVTVTGGDEYVSYPAVAAAPNGDFVVVWQAYPAFDEGNEIKARRFAADGMPAGPAFRVNTGVSGDQTRPAVAADAAGNFVVSWVNYDYPDAYYEISAQAFAHDGLPLGTQIQVSTFTGGQKQPAVAAGPAGSFVVTWWGDRYGHPQDYNGVFARRISLPSCSSEADCDDADLCTTDICENGICLDRRQPGCCHSTAECRDADPCTDDLCTEHACSNPAIPDCIACRGNHDCTPPNACTTAACDYDLHRCKSTPISGCCLDASDCSDGHACTTDACGANHTCTASPIADCIECTDAGDCSRGCLIGPEECLDGRCEMPAGCPLVDIDPTDPVGAEGQLLSRVRIPADVPGKGRIKVVVTGTIATGDADAAAPKGCRNGKRIGRSRAVVKSASDTGILLAFTKAGARCLAASADGTLAVDVHVRVRRKTTPLSEVSERRIWHQ